MQPVTVTPNPKLCHDLTKEYQWLINNADAYRGKWVALKHGHLIGSSESIWDLHNSIEPPAVGDGPLFIHRIPISDA